MAGIKRRRLPVGIQSFHKIRQGNMRRSMPSRPTPRHCLPTASTPSSWPPTSRRANRLSSSSTSITKFTQISLFSALNNLTNISFQPELEKMAIRNKWTAQETHDRLKDYYDGYHFSDDNMVDIYNPYSLVNALAQSRLRNFWISSGSTSLLPKFVDNAELRLGDFDNCRILRNTLESSDVTGGGAALFLYLSGYLTIKESDEFGYTLGFPNEEVKQALYEMVLPALTMREVIGLGLELDDEGKGLLDWGEVK